MLVGIETRDSCAAEEVEGRRPVARRPSCSASRSSRWTIRSKSRCARKRFVHARGAESRQGRRGPEPAFSAGNTGALMAVVALCAERRSPGIERPAIASAIAEPAAATRWCSTWAPTSTASRSICCSSRRWAHALVSAIEGRERPTIGLLNIGEEVIKGNDTIKRARRAAAREYAQLLRQRGRQRHLSKARSTSIVCDGFVGNVALKTSEGLAKMLIEHHQGRVRPFVRSREAAWRSLAIARA